MLSVALALAHAQETAIRSLWTQWKARYGLRYTGTVVSDKALIVLLLA